MRRRMFQWLGVIACIATLSGCRSESIPVDHGLTSSTDDVSPASSINMPAAKAGAQLWAENCTRCHYIRPPDAFSAPQWGLLMQHMRSRANLTGFEEREILKFLRAGSGSDLE
jgi:hypothetical protein